jgi:hypothetical protein
VQALLDDDGVDAVLVVHVGLGGDDPERRLGALEAAVQEHPSAKPVVACVVGGDGSLPERETRKIPNYRFPEAAVRALAIAADRRAWLGRRLGQEPELEGFDAAGAQAVVAAAGEGWLGGEETVALLRAAGLELAATPADASLGEADAVAVLAGAVNDPEFGPVVGVAPGGGLGWAGPIPGDAVFRLAPLTDVDAEELVDGPPALRAALHQGAHDAAALRDVLLRLAALADALPELAEAELDPVLVSEAGVVVGGARVRLAPPPQRDRAKTW